MVLPAVPGSETTIVAEVYGFDFEKTDIVAAELAARLAQELPEGCSQVNISRELPPGTSRVDFDRRSWR